jgi:hypothetical protein
MQVKALKVVSWVDANLPPLSWRIIVMKQMKLLLKHKIAPASIDENTYFNEEIVSVLKLHIKETYNKEMPGF